MTRVDATTGAVRANAKPRHIDLERFLCRAARAVQEARLTAACAVTAEGTSLPSERVSLLTEGEGDR